jgi:uncharacterized protein YhaN
MAEILATDHDGCVPILFGDAFAYTDPERVQSLQRMLNLGALRGLQVIVLTCTPNDYNSLGAPPIFTCRIIFSELTTFASLSNLHPNATSHDKTN